MEDVYRSGRSSEQSRNFNTTHISESAELVPSKSNTDNDVVTLINTEKQITVLKTSGTENECLPSLKTLSTGSL
jgi:hypothetical protein